MRRLFTLGAAGALTCMLAAPLAHAAPDASGFINNLGDQGIGCRRLVIFAVDLYRHRFDGLTRCEAQGHEDDQTRHQDGEQAPGKRAENEPQHLPMMPIRRWRGKVRRCRRTRPALR